MVPNVETALKAEDVGADAIIAEGNESGGIQGYKGASTMVLVPLVVDAVKNAGKGEGYDADRDKYEIHNEVIHFLNIILNKKK